MNETAESRVILYQQWILRIRSSASPSESQILLMIHGWTGDENSMQIFQRDISPNFLIIAPRGIIPAPEGGYGWIGHRPGREATLHAFIEPAQALRRLVHQIQQEYLVKNKSINLMGFSQGAALSLAYSLLYPEEVQKVAVLSGFMPYLPEKYQPSPSLKDISFFIAHGFQDDIVSIQRAYELVEFLHKAGAKVKFCESPVGHRISSACFRELNYFFNH